MKASENMAAMREDHNKLVSQLQTQLAETEQAMEQERAVSQQLAMKLASAEEMLTNVSSINDYLVHHLNVDALGTGQHRLSTFLLSPTCPHPPYLRSTFTPTPSTPSAEVAPVEDSPESVI